MAPLFTVGGYSLFIQHVTIGTMNNELNEILQNILNPNFDTDKIDSDTYANLAVLVVENRELYQKVLGKIAHALGTKYGEKKIANLAKDIEESSGYKVSPSTLRVYRWVYQKLLPVMDKIPTDYPYSTWKHLASTENPEMWLDKGISEGLSGAQLTREIYLALGNKTEKKVLSCPNCGKLIEV